MISDMELESILDQNSTDEQSKNLREWIIQYEQTFFGLIPTARASDYKGAMLCRFWAPHPELVHAEKNKRYHSQLHEHLELTPRGKIGQMNPNWIEWLMGFPIGWTELSA
jgi:hypothetical protein